MGPGRPGRDPAAFLGGPRSRPVHTDLDALLTELRAADFDRPPALVMNAHVTGLAVARSLAAHDVPVVALDRSTDGVAPRSRAVAHAGTVTYPLDDRAGFAADLERVAAALDHEPVAFGNMDEWVHALVETDPDGVRLPVADRETVQSVLNKRSLYGLAEELSVPYPETHWLDEVDPADAAAAVGYPLVVKPARKRAFEEVVGTNVVEAAGPEELHATVEVAREADLEVAVQEKVPVATGEDRSFASYVGPDGDALGVVGNARVRQPRGFGTSCVVDLVADPTVRERATRVLEAAGYHGISEAEFVHDSERGTDVLLDINTRPWKWVGMPVAAGADLPYAAYADAVGAAHEPAVRDPAEADLRWLSLRDYLAGLEAGTPDVLAGGTWADLVSGAFEDRTDLTTAVYRPSDPGPTTRLLEELAGAPEYYCAC